MQDGQHSDVGFSSSSGRTDQQVLIGIVCRIEHHRLDTVQLFCAFESKPGNLEEEYMNKFTVKKKRKVSKHTQKEKDNNNQTDHTIEMSTRC